MANLNTGYLFEKKYITFNSEEWEIFEFIDYVAAICYENKYNDMRYNIVSGDKTGFYANPINKNQKEELVFIEEDLNKVIQNNNYIVNFEEIRKNKISKTAKYYQKNNKGGLTKLENNELLNFLENYKRKEEFSEKSFEKSTDISDMYLSIKKTIISQDEQIMKILTALFKNQKVVSSNLDNDLISKLKENILICGSTGTGKTEILKRISKLYDIPIVIEDTTALSETGYQGRKITDMLEDLCQAANNDINLAEKGILVLDEFDKIAEKDGDSQSHVSRLGVQRSLLKLLDGSIFYFDNKKFDTSKLTIVGLGAFTGITKSDDYKKITTEDFMKYGIMRELIGRFSKTIAMNPLNKEDIIKILKESDFSPLNTYKKLFEMLQVKFEFNDDFIEYIAEKAIYKKSGARSLKTIFDECISSALFRIFAGEYSEISLIKPKNEDEQPYILKKINKK